jgi:hypothetical protein
MGLYINKNPIEDEDFVFLPHKIKHLSKKDRRIDLKMKEHENSYE